MVNAREIIKFLILDGTVLLEAIVNHVRAIRPHKTAISDATCRCRDRYCSGACFALVTFSYSVLGVAG